jgi:ubiquinone/menaquinone biosynthesis C-methylase UbiE
MMSSVDKGRPERDGGDCDHEDHHTTHLSGRGVMDEATAEWYATNYGEDPTNEVTVECAALRRGDVVLDIGCGSGPAVRQAATMVVEGIAIGIDRSPSMLRIAARETAGHAHRARIALVEGDASELPVGDGSVTVAWAINSLHHWDRPMRGLREVHRVLSSQGRFLATEDEHGEGRFGHGDGPFSDAGFVMRALEEAGFEGVEMSKHIRDEVTILVIACRRAEY